MNQWVERYVTAVVSYLPEKERPEVERELKSNIADMLSEEPTEVEVKAVLMKLGAPAELAESYRQNPRYLISPRIYGDYIKVIKYLVPAGGGVGLLVGLVTSVFDDFNFQNSFQSAFSFGIFIAMQVLVWTTVGFVIAERTGAFSKGQAQEWRFEDLPEVVIQKKIPLADCIGEFGMTVVVCSVVLLEILGYLPLVQEGERIPLFGNGLLGPALFVAAGSVVLSLIANGLKLKVRYWNKKVGFWALLDSLGSAVLWLFLFLQPNFFSPKFLAFLDRQEWHLGDKVPFLTFMVEPFIVVACCLIIFGTAIECLSILVKMFKYSRAVK